MLLLPLNQACNNQTNQILFVKQLIDLWVEDLSDRALVNFLLLGST